VFFCRVDAVAIDDVADVLRHLKDSDRGSCVTHSKNGDSPLLAIRTIHTHNATRNDAIPADPGRKTPILRGICRTWWGSKGVGVCRIEGRDTQR